MPENVVRSSSWRGGNAPTVEPPVLAPAPTQEDEHDKLMDQLAEGAAYDIMQLSSDRIGLVVNGELRATYRKESVYVPGATTAKVQLEAAKREAQRARNIVRSFDRATKRSGSVRRDVGESAADGLDTQVEAPGLERWLGPLTDATEAERAIARDRRKAATGTDGHQGGPVFEKVEGV